MAASTFIAYDVNGFHNGGGEPRIVLPDGRIVGTSTFLKPCPQGDKRRSVAHRWSHDRGGRRYAVEPWGAAVSGLPRDVPAYPILSRVWWSRINWFSDIVQLEDGVWLSTLCLHFQGDARGSTVALISEDEGRNWTYLSTVADADAVADATEGFDKPCLVQLETGEQWQAVDVMAYHNRVLASEAQTTANQTTAYTALVKVASDEVFLVYDRTPLGWSPVVADSAETSQTYLLAFRVVRTQKPKVC